MFLVVELLNFRKIDETLSRPYILITHNSDFSFSRRIIRAAENSPNLRHWFGQNLESNSKLTTIPIGFENYRWGRMKPDIYSRLHGRNLVKSFLAVANFNPRNDERKNLLSILQKQSWVQIIDIGYSDANSNMSLHEKHESWLSSQQKFKYAFSPFGNGIDCHRTWEMLLIGVIPIVKSSILDDLFRPLEAKGAIIITKDWSDIDESFLLSHWETVGNDYIDRIWTLKVPEELYMDFWISKIHSKLNF